MHYTDRRADAAPDKIAAELRAFLSERDHAGAEVRPIAAGIEDSFMELMSRQPSEAAAAA